MRSTGARALLSALGLFTIVPVRRHELDRDTAGRALLWWPLVGAALGAVVALPLAAIQHWAPRGTLIGAVLAVALLAIATRALHLDGLADTADGLGSRADAPRALEIMRRSDIGPFGVVTLVLVLGADAAALASFDRVWQPVAALAISAAAGRSVALAAAHRRVPGARPDGFGALVTGSASTLAVLAWTAVTLVAAGLIGEATHASPAGWVLGTAVALVLSAAFLAQVIRRLGGVTGDVFGALVELGTALTLVALALAG